MRFLRGNLPSIAENLALDEALLERVDHPDNAPLAPDLASHEELLRIWHAESPFVVLGRSSQIQNEVHLPLADALQVPIFRRISGGTSIVADQGCMFYTLLISLEHRPHLRMLDAAHQYVMSRMCDALREIQPAVTWTGTCDLVIGNRKIGGNSLRIGRRWMLYHGTLLLAMNLEWIERLLQHPPREPEYRGGRSHLDFVTNLAATEETVIDCLQTRWQAFESHGPLPLDEVQQLVAQRYSKTEWNRQR